MPRIGLRSPTLPHPPPRFPALPHASLLFPALNSPTSPLRPTLPYASLRFPTLPDASRRFPTLPDAPARCLALHHADPRQDDRSRDTRTPRNTRPKFNYFLKAHCVFLRSTSDRYKSLSRTALGRLTYPLITRAYTSIY